MNTPGQTLHSRCQPERPLRERQETVMRSRYVKALHMVRWWSQTGSNRRPHACKARALPTELWPLMRQLQRQAVVRSIWPQGVHTQVCHLGSVVGPGRLELPTSRLSGVCSNQLSYRPLKRFALTWRNPKVSSQAGSRSSRSTSTVGGL